MKKAPLLVTGAHRSGTTWVGKMLAEAPPLVYVHEPFNPENGALFSALGTDRWFPFAPDAGEDWYRSELDRICRLRYPLLRSLREVDSGAALRRVAREALQYFGHRMRGRRALLKDPIAVFSAEWIARRFGAQVLVCIPHPAAFAGSLKVKGWTFPFRHLRDQPQLMDGLLSSYRSEIENFAETERDIVEQAGLLWTLIYSVVRRYQQRHDDWIFVRHEDLARSPVKSFRKLYDELGLDFNDEIRRTIERHSDSQNPVEAESVGKIQRDSRALIYSWQDRLTQEEITQVRRRTAPVASHFYSDDDW